jgi:hypothetical protein
MNTGALTRRRGAPIAARQGGRYIAPSVPCDFENISGFVQLDLFGDRPNYHRPSDGVTAKPIAPEGLSDDDLISSIPDAALAEASAMAAEAGKRRLSAAVPVLTSLCNRLTGHGAGAVAPEQVAALNALGAIGGQEAANAVSKLISKKIVQGPTMIAALTVASQLGVVLPSDVSLTLLRDPASAVRGRLRLRPRGIRSHNGAGLTD